MIKKAMLYLNHSDDIVVKNSIFAKNENADNEEFVDFSTSVPEFHNNAVWNTTNYSVDNGTVSDTLHIDPLFTDAANADFTIGEVSLFTYADDGGAIGDPRWAPAVEEGNCSSGCSRYRRYFNRYGCGRCR